MLSSSHLTGFHKKTWKSRAGENAGDNPNRPSTDEELGQSGPPRPGASPFDFHPCLSKLGSDLLSAGLPPSGVTGPFSPVFISSRLSSLKLLQPLSWNPWLASLVCLTSGIKGDDVPRSQSHRCFRKIQTVFRPHWFPKLLGAVTVSPASQAFEQLSWGGPKLPAGVQRKETPGTALGTQALPGMHMRRARSLSTGSLQAIGVHPRL